MLSRPQSCQRLLWSGSSRSIPLRAHCCRPCCLLKFSLGYQPLRKKQLRDSTAKFLGRRILRERSRLLLRQDSFCFQQLNQWLGWQFVFGFLRRGGDREHERHSTGKKQAYY